jgi:hypothetical protein
MICLRCGECCKHYFVVIVDDPAKGPAESNLKTLDGSAPCQHLRGDTPGHYSCAIHHYPWYKNTPCGHHEQIGKPNDECRLGQFILSVKPSKSRVTRDS